MNRGTIRQQLEQLLVTDPFRKSCQLLQVSEVIQLRLHEDSSSALKANDICLLSVSHTYNE